MTKKQTVVRTNIRYNLMKLRLIATIIFCLFLSCSAEENIMKKTIAIDLDGVLDNYTKYTDYIPPIRKGAKEFIIKLSKDYDLVLFTTRSPMLATKWLISNKIDKYFTDVTNNKIPAYIYIDDRAINFSGNYDETLREIGNFKVHWK